jgi:hypothetical protein
MHKKHIFVPLVSLLLNPAITVPLILMNVSFSISIPSGEKNVPLVLDNQKVYFILFILLIIACSLTESLIQKQKNIQNTNYLEIMENRIRNTLPHLIHLTPDNGLLQYLSSKLHAEWLAICTSNSEPSTLSIKSPTSPPIQSPELAIAPSIPSSKIPLDPHIPAHKYPHPHLVQSSNHTLPPAKKQKIKRSLSLQHKIPDLLPFHESTQSHIINISSPSHNASDIDSVDLSKVLGKMEEAITALQYSIKQIKDVLQIEK